MPVNWPALLGGPARGSHNPRLLNHATAPAGAGRRQESPPALESWPPAGPETAQVSWTGFLDNIGGNGQT